MHGCGKNDTPRRPYFLPPPLRVLGGGVKTFSFLRNSNTVQGGAATSRTAKGSTGKRVSQNPSITTVPCTANHYSDHLWTRYNFHPCISIFLNCVRFGTKKEISPRLLSVPLVPSPISPLGPQSTSLTECDSSAAPRKAVPIVNIIVCAPITGMRAVSPKAHHVSTSRHPTRGLVRARFSERRMGSGITGCSSSQKASPDKRGVLIDTPKPSVTIPS